MPGGAISAAEAGIARAAMNTAMPGILNRIKVPPFELSSWLGEQPFARRLAEEDLKEMPPGI